MIYVPVAPAFIALNPEIRSLGHAVGYCWLILRAMVETKLENKRTKEAATVAGEKQSAQPDPTYVQLTRRKKYCLWRKRCEFFQALLTFGAFHSRVVTSIKLRLSAVSSTHPWPQPSASGCHEGRLNRQSNVMSKKGFWRLDVHSLCV